MGDNKLQHAAMQQNNNNTSFRQYSCHKL